ncbi:MAG: hypothetical protein WBE26_07370 [Phycisphaerae bacterium]
MQSRSGGMGTVYEAVQEHPRRTVAVKVLKHGVASRSAMRRFEYESQILARLRHPGIAQVYEAGTHQPDPSRDHEGVGITEAVPFFAMEYIPQPIACPACRRRRAESCAPSLPIARRATTISSTFRPTNRGHSGRNV